MMTRRFAGILFLLCFVGCNNSSEKNLRAGGATFIDPIMSKWTHEYEKLKRIQVNYQGIGSGSGIQQMTEQIFDFGCSDGPMNDEQLKKAVDTNGPVVHIPLVLGAAVPAYNLPDLKTPIQFSGPVLADIFLGNIKNWNDPALRKLNPGAALPDKEILVVHRSDGSGTTYIWTDYLAKVSAQWKKDVGVGTSVKWPAHATSAGGNGNNGIAGIIKRSPGSIGYLELIYAVQNDIDYGAVQNKDGEFIRAGLQSVTAAANAALKDIPEDLRYSMTDAPGKESYPIAGTSWAICYTRPRDGKGNEVRDFLYWCTHEGQEYCEKLHYSRLPKALVERAEKRLALIK